MVGLTPGIHAIPPERYHADPCEAPSLSAHTIHTLLNRSPLHAWTNSPRLNPAYERTERDSFDLGSAVHDLWLRSTAGTIAVIEAPDWRTKDAQEQKAAAREAGQIPLLSKDWTRVQEMLGAIRDQLAARDDDPPLFAEGGKPEQTVVWSDGGVQCRALLDWVHGDLATIDDLKSTAASANPHAWCRTTLWNIGADIQLAFHGRGLRAITGAPVLFRFCVVENTPPYALSVVTLGPAALALANDKIDRALETWKRCLETDIWPAYTRELCYADPPPWMESQWMEQQAIEDVAA